MNEIQYEKPPGTESPSTDQRQKFVSNEFRDDSAELNLIFCKNSCCVMMPFSINSSSLAQTDALAKLR
jgi:hypothetical protein